MRLPIKEGTARRLGLRRAGANGRSWVQATIAPWFVVEHCCEAGSMAYPEVCPWHPDHRDEWKP
jgi:hypothetical protein